MRAPGFSRLRGIAAHLAPTAGEQAHDAAVEVAARLLTEEQLAQFVVNGFIAIEPPPQSVISWASYHEKPQCVISWAP